MDDDKNPIQDDYDQKLRPQEQNAQGKGGGDERTLHERESLPDKDDPDVLSPEEQASVDQKEGAASGNLYQPGTASKQPAAFRARLKGVFGGRKKWGWIAGGVATLLGGGLLVFLPVLGPLHIFSNLASHNFEYNDYYRRNRTTRIIKSIFNRYETNRQLADTPFKLKADLIDFEKFESHMKINGWSFEYNADGKPIALIKPDGSRANFDDPDINRRAEIDNLVKKTIPAWQMNKRVRTRALVSTFSGPRRSFNWSKLFGRDKTTEPDFDVARFKKEAGIDRIDVDGRVRIVGEDGADSPADKALQATVDAKLDGATDADALNIGVTEAKKAATPSGGRTSLIIGTTIVGCIAYAVYDNELQSQFERYAASLRYGATFMLAVNEMQQGGDIDIGEVGQLFGEYNNHESTTVEVNNVEEVYNEDTKEYEVVETSDTVDVPYDNNVGSFAQSAAWQRATGEEVTGPEINDEYRVNPTGDALSTVNNIFLGTLGAIGEIVANIPGFSTICSIVNSSFGFIIGIAFDIIEGVLAIAACASGVGCVFLAKFAIVEGLFELATRMIGAALTGFAGYLTDNPVQSAAILDQSLNLISSEENRSGAPIDSEDYNAELAIFKRKQNGRRAFGDRYFSLDNPQSLAATLASAKMSYSSADLSPSNIISYLLRLPGSSLVAGLTSKNVYAQTNLDFDNYGFQKYTLDNDYLDVDPFTNAASVLRLIETDKSIYLDEDNGNYARDFAVMCMGYSVEDEEVDKSELNRNFLSVYSDPQAFPNAQARNDAFQKVCLEEANSPENINLYSRIGRFVDDMELVQSMGELSTYQD